MPYLKFNIERYFYFSERWAFTIGLNFIYNFGMELVLSMSFRHPK